MSRELDTDLAILNKQTLWNHIVYDILHFGYRKVRFLIWFRGHFGKGYIWINCFGYRFGWGKSCGFGFWRR